MRPVTWSRRFPPMLRSRRLWQIALGLAVTLAFVALFTRDLPVDEFLDALSGLSIWTLGAAVMLLAAGYAVRVVRWWVMLRAEDPGLSLRACAWPLITSVAANNVLPLRAGDVLRVVGFRRHLRAPASRVLGTLVLERLLDLITLLTLLAVGLIIVPSEGFPSGLLGMAVGLLLLVSAGVVVVVLAGPPLVQKVSRWIAARPRFVAAGRSAVIEAAALQISRPLALIRSPRQASALLGLSILAWAFEGAVFAAVAFGMGLGVGVFVPWLAMAAGTLATLLPSAPGYVGTFDYAVRETVATQGVAIGPASAFAVAVHAALWVPLTLAGLLYLATIGRGVWQRRAAVHTHLEETSRASSS